MKKFRYLSLFALFLIQGCSSSQMEGFHFKESVVAKNLRYTDVHEAISKCVYSLLDSGVLKKRDDSKPFLMVGDFKNKILPHINTNTILQDIRLMILDSDQAVAIPAPKKSLTKGALPTFDFLLTGEVKEKKDVDNPEKKCYLVNLKLTDLKTKLVIWEADEKLLK